jgi:hypothetical protein
MGSAERALSLRTIFYRTGAISWECIETEVEEQSVKECADQPKADSTIFPSFT